jgi:tight adherence protein C
MTPLLVSACFFLLLGAAALGIYMATFGQNRSVEERFADIAVKIRIAQGTLEDEKEQDTISRLVFKWAVKHLPPPDPTTAEGEKLSQTLLQAGFRKASAAQIFQVIRIGAGVVGIILGIVASAVLHRSGTEVLVLAIAGMAVGLFLPSYYLGKRARNRQNAIARQLSDVLDLLVVCVEAGLGLYEAIKIVGNEAERQKQEIGTELGMVAGEISAGASLGQALKSLADRTAVEDIKPLAATLIQSEQLGAQIAPALNASSDALRTRRRLRAEEAAQKASIKILFPLVLFVLPAMIAVIIGPAMIQVLHTLKGGF